MLLHKWLIIITYPAKEGQGPNNTAKGLMAGHTWTRDLTQSVVTNVTGHHYNQ